MIQISVEQYSAPILDLNDLQKKLEKIRYYGQLTLVWQDGQIILIREERTLKPSQFDQLI